MKRGTNRGNGTQKSHVPVPEDRRKTNRARLSSKEKEQTNTCKNDTKGELEEKERPVLAKQNSKPFLLEENAKLKEDIQSKTEQIKEMENALKVQSENIDKLKFEAQNREKVSQDNLEMMVHKCELAESKLAEHQNRLLQSNIDPIVLEQIDVSAEDKENVFKKQMQAKEEVASLRENVKSFTCMVDEQLLFLQTKETELDGIIGCGEKT